MSNTVLAEYAKAMVGDTITDRDGYIGRIVKVTEWKGSRWYDVRFSSGDAVRYDADIASVIRA